MKRLRIAAFASLLGTAGSLLAIGQQGPASGGPPIDDGLSNGFARPPDSAKPRTWWHWVSGNVSSEGITADLAAMKKIGLGGAQIFTVDQSAVKGPVVFMSSEWRHLVHQALDEASADGFEMAMEGCDGWSESGGPWVPASESMQKVVWSERQEMGGRTIAVALDQPETILGFYEDIALLAFPTPEGSNPPAPIKISSNDPAFDGAKLLRQGCPPLPFDIGSPKEPHWIQFEYAGAVTLRSVHVATTDVHASWDVLAGSDGVHFHKVGSVENDDRSWPRQDVTRASFDRTTATFYRLVWRSGSSKEEKVSVTAVDFGGAQLDHVEARIGLLPAVNSSNFTQMALSPKEVIDPAMIVSLTGKSEWLAPPGAWTIVRIGHTSTGATTHPSTAGGLECDKLSATAVQHHIQNMFDPVFADSPDRVGQTLRYILLDSWEAGCENWTPEMPSEFRARRGYDLSPWLAALTGKIVGSAELTQRFLWDYRRTVADLVAERHYGVIQSYAHAHGMGLMSEASGIGMPTVADQLLCKKYTDIPMGEFWTWQSRDDRVDDPKETACAAHIYGSNIAATESFTSYPNQAAWKNDPYSLKAMGDSEFCLGVNRFVFHRYAHQPWPDRRPGMSMGPWGINFERTNTWWEQGSAWVSYLSRCQFLLQQGLFQADLCYFYGEGAPVCVQHASLQPAVPKGYDYDVCNADVLLNLMEAKDGRISLPSGMRYRVLVLPKTDRMTLALLQKVARLVQSGATVYGPKPSHTPTLTGYPESDRALSRLADEVWGPCDGRAVTEHAYGKGRIVWGEPLEKVLAVPPDFAASTGDLIYIHRRDDASEIYFVSNQEQGAMTAQCTFRVAGKIPELWNPDTGTQVRPALYHEENGRTTLPIHFDPVGSVFVVFRRAAPANPPVATVKLGGKVLFGEGDDAPAEIPTVSHGDVSLTVWKAGSYELTLGTGQLRRVEAPALPASIELSGPWQLSFPPKLGAPEATSFDRLVSWTDSDVEGIKYFSGTATYEKEFTLPAAFLDKDHAAFLDLGSVKNIAEVSLNGRPLAILWKEPFRVEITDAARPGANHLAIKVTNLWPNRLIGDQRLPEAQRITWASVSLYKPDSPLLPSGLLGPVRVIPTETLVVDGTPSSGGSNTP